MSGRSTSLLQIRQLRRQYGNTVAVDVDSLDVISGEILCLLPTGAGKSTLLRLLAGVEQPTSGSVTYMPGNAPTHLLPLSVRRRMTMVFQKPVLLSGTVRRNVEQGLRLRGAPLSDVEQRMDHLGLTRLALQSARTLSGGQAQLVALARALVLRPDVLLLDEPTAHLDPAHVARVEQVLRDEHQERKATIVWSTHNLFQARRSAQRIALVLSGRLIEVASTAAFFDSPTDPRTKAFVEGKLVY